MITFRISLRKRYHHNATKTSARVSINACLQIFNNYPLSERVCYIHGFLHTYCSRKSVRTPCARAWSWVRVWLTLCYFCCRVSTTSLFDAVSWQILYLSLNTSSTWILAESAQFVISLDLTDYLLSHSHSRHIQVLPCLYFIVLIYSYLINSRSSDYAIVAVSYATIFRSIMLSVVQR